MTTIPFFHKRNAGIDKLPEKIQESIHLNQNEINITEGSEFLDDALRMKDQPLGETTVKENE